MATFSGGYLIDPRTNRPVAGAPLRVFDFATGSQVVPDGGEIASGPTGGYPIFSLTQSGDINAVKISGGGVEQVLVSIEKQLSGGGISGTQVKTSVTTSTALPATGNASGDLRLAEDTDRYWLWDGTQWVDAGPVGVPGPTPDLTPYATRAYVTDATSGLVPASGFGEMVDDRVAGLLRAGTGVTLDYDDAANALTVSASGGAAAKGLEVNLADFGIVGDGVADDTAKMMQAVAAVKAAGGGTIVIPRTCRCR